MEFVVVVSATAIVVVIVSVNRRFDTETEGDTDPEGSDGCRLRRRLLKCRSGDLRSRGPFPPIVVTCSLQPATIPAGGSSHDSQPSTGKFFNGVEHGEDVFDRSFLEDGVMAGSGDISAPGGHDFQYFPGFLSHKIRGFTIDQDMV